jgi:hypothetical protein
MKYKLYSLLLALASITVGCGGGGGAGSGTPGPAVSGTLSGNGYAVNTITDRILNKLFKSAFAVSSTTPNQIVVFYNHGNYNQSFPIASDGTFTIDTTGMSGNLVAFVVNSVSKTLFCHLNLSAGTETLDAIPTNSLVSNLVLGRVDTTNNCATGVTVSNTSAFSASDITNLDNIARNDAGLGLYINNLINDNIQFYNAVRFEMGAMSNIIGSYNTVSNNNFKATYYAGSSPLIYLGSANKSVTAVSIYPPSSVTYATTPLFTVNPSYGSTATPTQAIRKSGLTYNSNAGVTTVETNAIGSFPNGAWNVFDYSTGSDGTQLGKFYLDGSNPFDANGYFKGFIPKLNISSDQSGNLQTISVQLFTQQSDGSLTQVTNGYWNNLIDQSVFSYVLNGSNTSGNFVMSAGNSSDTTITFTPPTTMATTNISRVIFSYYIGQNKYQFFFE